MLVWRDSRIGEHSRLRNAYQHAPWAYSWLSCPSFRPLRAGWFWVGRSAATGSRHTLLPKRIALPVFASDALSSVAYAPEEIFLMLSVAGLAAYALAPWIGLAVVVGACWSWSPATGRTCTPTRPAAATTRWSPPTSAARAGLTVASALLVDYVLTVAVSMSSAMSNIGSARPVRRRSTRCCSRWRAILLLTAMNLRGIRESGTAFAIPTYAFMIGMRIMIGWGLFRIFVLGEPLRAESAGFAMHAEHGDVVGFALVFLVAAVVLVGLRGADRCRGDQQRRAGVPEAQVAQRRNHAAAARACIAVTLFMGIIVLAEADRRPDRRATRATQLAGAPAGYHQKTLVAQLAEAVFSAASTSGFY